MDANQTITSEEAQARLLSAYRAGDSGGFAEFVKRPFLNPIEQRDHKNRRKVHPLLVIGLVLLALALAATLFFSHGDQHATPSAKPAAATQ